MREAVRTIFSGDGMRKIEVYSRPDKLFSFSILKWSAPEKAWVVVGPQTASLSASARAAVTEALSRADWAREGGPGSPVVDSALEAKGLVERVLGSPELVVVDEATQEKTWGWVFTYQSRRYLESGDYRDALAGNSPLLVNRRTGEIIVTGTARPVDDYVESYEEELAGAA